ncbi:MAG: HAD family hydrolase [Myxococcota bacterium]|nr:HAD family hydrolase [Myxococcota bacterium]
MTRRYVFLDRDGTLVRDPGYVHREGDYELLPGVPAALRELAAAGFRLAIVTNQSGIGRGLFGADDFARFQRLLLDDLAREGVEIDATFHCPHTPDAGCGCRKPAPGMLHAARETLGAELGASWMVGDSERDVGLARRAGCRGAVRLHEAARGELAEDALSLEAVDLVAAARLLLRWEAGSESRGHGAP